MRFRAYLTISVVILSNLSLTAVAFSKPQKEATPKAAAPSILPLAESLKGTAREDYDSAKVLYGDGDFQGALQKLKSAYQTSSDPRLLWNMAACEKNLRHYGQSLAYVERYLADGKALVSADDLAEAEAFIKTIREFVTELSITVNEPGAAITIDDQPVGTSPLAEPLKVEMGRHRIRIHKDGFEDFEWNQELGGGRDAVSITAQLSPQKHEGKLRIMAGTSDAIQIDGKVVGAGVWEGILPSGSHAVNVTGKGKVPETTDVLVRDGETNTLRIALENEKTNVTADGGGLPSWVWIAGGVVVAGMGVGGYFLFKPGDSPGYRPTQQGTWGAISL